MEVILYILIVVLLLIFKLWWDFRAKNKGRIINHFRSAMIDGVIYFLSAYILFCYPSWCSIKFMFGIMIVSIWFRWVFFDLLFNKLNGWKWNHYGKSAWQDRQLTKLGKWHLVPKFVLIIGGIILLL